MYLSDLSDLSATVGVRRNENDTAVEQSAIQQQV